MQQTHVLAAKSSYKRLLVAIRTVFGADEGVRRQAVQRARDEVAARSGADVGPDAAAALWAEARVVADHLEASVVAAERTADGRLRIVPESLRPQVFAAQEDPADWEGQDCANIDADGNKIVKEVK